MKTCLKCSRELPDGQFFKASSNVCKDCKRAQNKLWKYRAANGIPLPPIQCRWCGEQFTPRNGNVRYCSDTCRAKAANMLHKKYRMNMSRRKEAAS